MSKLKVSAVIPTKNRPGDLAIAVQSVLAQVERPDQLVVIDQTPSDDGKRAVEKLFADDALSHSGVAAIELSYVLDSNIKGLVAARQAAIPLCSGDLVMFFEDDVVLDPNFIGRMRAVFERRADVMGTSGVISNFHPSRIYRFFHRLFHRGIFFDARLDWHGRTIDTEILVPSVFLNGGLSAYRREVFDKVKYDCRNGFHMVEDIEFSVRAAETFGRERFFIVPSARLLHTEAPGGRTSLATKYKNKTREYILFFKKRRRSLRTVVDVAWLLVGMAAEAVLAVVRHRRLEPLIGMLNGLVSGFRQRLLD